ncbi:hypothetical protein [Brevundimonas sp.]|jgi:hypothetical protein|uniref:hypothetical protein n=1 Tax=Brevundimonas sp. TaxID=1871086 RepID=UPI0025BB051C|nr:hypothetical protein [Brevundimonas sp.]
MSRLIAAVVLIAAVGAAACTPTYVAPKGAPTAHIALTRGALTDADHAELMVSNAEWSRRANISGGLLFAYDKPEVIAAGVPMYFELQTERTAGVTMIFCGSHFVFVPAAGHSYVVSPNEAGTRCSLTLTDAATGRTPDTFRVEPVQEGWSPAD